MLPVTLPEPVPLMAVLKAWLFKLKVAVHTVSAVKLKPSTQLAGLQLVKVLLVSAVATKLIAVPSS